MCRCAGRRSRGRAMSSSTLERPGASADGGIYRDRIDLQNVFPQFKWPDLSGHARLARNWGYVQVAGIVRKIAWVDTTAAKPNLSGSAVGWGVNVTSNLNFTKKDVGRFAVVYGEGIENYMNDAPVDIGVVNNFSNPARPIKGVALPVLGVVAFLDHSVERPVQHCGQLFAVEHRQFERNDTRLISSRTLCLGKSSLSSRKTSNGGRRISMGKAREFYRRLQCERLQDAVLLPV